MCINIANQFNITVAQLEAANTEIDPLCDNLQIGEVDQSCCSTYRDFANDSRLGSMHSLGLRIEVTQ